MDSQRVYCIRIINEEWVKVVDEKLKNQEITIENAEKEMQKNFYMLKTYNYLLASTIQQNMTMAGHFCEIDIELTSKFDKDSIT